MKRSLIAILIASILNGCVGDNASTSQTGNNNSNNAKLAYAKTALIKASGEHHIEKPDYDKRKEEYEKIVVDHDTAKPADNNQKETIHNLLEKLPFKLTQTFNKQGGKIILIKSEDNWVNTLIDEGVKKDTIVTDKTGRQVYISHAIVYFDPNPEKPTIYVNSNIPYHANADLRKELYYGLTQGLIKSQNISFDKDFIEAVSSYNTVAGIENYKYPELEYLSKLDDKDISTEENQEKMATLFASIMSDSLEYGDDYNNAWPQIANYLKEFEKKFDTIDNDSDDPCPKSGGCGGNANNKIPYTSTQDYIKNNLNHNDTHKPMIEILDLIPYQLLEMIFSDIKLEIIENDEWDNKFAEEVTDPKDPFNPQSIVPDEVKDAIVYQRRENDSINNKIFTKIYIRHYNDAEYYNSIDNKVKLLNAISSNLLYLNKFKIEPRFLNLLKSDNANKLFEDKPALKKKLFEVFNENISKDKDLIALFSKIMTDYTINKTDFKNNWPEMNIYLDEAVKYISDARFYSYEIETFFNEKNEKIQNPVTIINATSNNTKLLKNVIVGNPTKDIYDDIKDKEIETPSILLSRNYKEPIYILSHYGTVEIPNIYF